VCIVTLHCFWNYSLDVIRRELQYTDFLKMASVDAKTCWSRKQKLICDLVYTVIVHKSWLIKMILSSICLSFNLTYDQNPYLCCSPQQFHVLLHFSVHHSSSHLLVDDACFLRVGVLSSHTMTLKDTPSLRTYVASFQF
jgi:hypothetical protein